MNVKAYCLIIGLAACIISGCKAQQGFDGFTKQFVTTYKSFNIPGLALSYVENLNNLPAEAGVTKQEAFFKQVLGKLALYTKAQLTKQQQVDYDLIQYEGTLTLEKLALSKSWLKIKPASMPATGLYTIPQGKEWYAWFLKTWVAADVTPDEIYQFGLKEVERVKKHIEDIRLQTGLSEDAFYTHLNDSIFFVTSPAAIQQAFEDTKRTVLQNMHNVFNVRQVQDVAIARGSNSALAQTPGYYNDNTFYYNLFGKPYNRRQFDWLFIHEAVPGHHYQSSIAAQVKQSAVQQLFYYLGFSEGWAAYVEELGKQLGVYKTPYDELGKWEWDIVRSVRVPLDVGINYYGWTDEQALTFWKKNIRGQDEIAMREIARIKRWPAQVVSYKYGAYRIMQLKEKLQQEQGHGFDIKVFHDKVLNHGSLPFFIVEKNVTG